MKRLLTSFVITYIQSLVIPVVTFLTTLGNTIVHHGEMTVSLRILFLATPWALAVWPLTTYVPAVPVRSAVCGPAAHDLSVLIPGNKPPAISASPSPPNSN